MITKQEQRFIEKYVDENFYDKVKLIKYLDLHDIVGNEVFSYCDKRNTGRDIATYSSLLDDEHGYCPIPVADFVKRVPFYFYTKDVQKLELDNMGTLHYILSSAWSQKNDDIEIEEVYEDLEYMFYSLNLSLDKIFSYWINQTGYVCGNGFFQWNHYLHLCEGLGKSDYFPERFITAYNEVLEESKLPPIIYEISECGLGDPYYRNGTLVEFEGTFPCDENGNPIMKWIGIKATNIKNITCTTVKSKKGYLRFNITPNTIINVLNFYNQDENEDYWYQVYAGPQTMQFDYKILKEQRKKLGFTQQQVADAVETTVRTYQKWEAGNTIPDGHFLIRLLNWLDIPDIQDAIKY